MESNGDEIMRVINYSEIKKQKWDSDILSLIGGIYKVAGKQELYLKQRSLKLPRYRVLRPPIP